MSNELKQRALISATDRRGQRCCPNCHRAVRITGLIVEFHGETDDAAERARQAALVQQEAKSIERTARLLVRPPLAMGPCRSGAAQAALLEELARRGEVVCGGDGEKIDVPGLVARLKAGTVWS